MHTLQNISTVLLNINLEKRKLLFLLGFSVLYFTGTIASASVKLAWYDELLTLYVARLPTISDIWEALGSGFELNPPLYHLLARLTCQILGNSEISIRLPAIVGFWVLCLCLFQFIANRLSVNAAGVALLLPLATGAFPYSFEARPYGLLLGCCGLALVCWQRVLERKGRKLFLIGLALALAAGVSSHYYALLLFVPLMCAELVRSRRLNKVDWPIWCSMAAGLAPLVAFMPLIKVGIKHSASTWTLPLKPAALLPVYEMLVGPLAVPVLTGIMTLLTIQGLNGRQKAVRKSLDTLPIEETVVALSLTVLPIMGLSLGAFITGVFTARYVLAAVIGLTVFIVVAANRAEESSPAIGIAFIIILMGWFLLTDIRVYRDLSIERSRQSEALRQLASESPSDVPILVGDALMFYQLHYYSSPNVRSRLHQATRVGGESFLSRFYPIKDERLDTFLGTYRSFMVYADAKTAAILIGKLYFIQVGNLAPATKPAPQWNTSENGDSEPNASWVRSYLSQRNQEIQIKSIIGGDILFLVTVKS